MWVNNAKYQRKSNSDLDIRENNLNNIFSDKNNEGTQSRNSHQEILNKNQDRLETKCK